MEYVTYILIILGIMALCLYLLRDSGRILVIAKEPSLSEKIRAHSIEKKATKNTTDTETSRVSPTLNGEALSVPTPWGWPGHLEHATVKNRNPLNAQEVHGVSESLHRFVDHLISEKQTVEDQNYLLKKDASIRALIEDRYGRAYTAAAARHRKVGDSPIRNPDEILKMEPLRDLKTPWGW